MGNGKGKHGLVKCQLTLCVLGDDRQFSPQRLATFLRGRRSARGINAEHVSKIAQILLLLNSANALEAMEVPGFRTHRLQGDLKDFHAVTVRANWRIIFRFDDGNAFDVDLVDYH